MNDMKRNIICNVLLILMITILWDSAVAKKKVEVIRDITLSMIDNNLDVARKFGQLDYGLRIQVKNEVDDYNLVDLKELPIKEATSFPQVYTEGSLSMNTEQNLDRLATSLGFEVGGDFDTDYILVVTIKQCSLKVRSYDIKHKEFKSSAAVILSWELLDAEYKPVIGSTTVTGHSSSNTQNGIANPLRDAYFKALKDIDWNRIAPKLKISRNSSSERNKQVEGKGNTALEHSVIRWYIVSSPSGADVTWRVISSTPDVKNTNSNFVGTTPYESTESFDIKGLTYNNSGDVQIEISCEKPGYVTQRKRFNLRQAIDQKEISTKFSLVKESEEQ